MSRYDRISRSNFVKKMLRRFDSVTAVTVMIAFAICAVLAPTVGFCNQTLLTGTSLCA